MSAEQRRPTVDGRQGKAVFAISKPRPYEVTVDTEGENPVPFTTALIQKLLRKGQLKRAFKSQGRSFPLNAQQAKELNLVVPPDKAPSISLKGLPDETPYIRYIPAEGNFRIERVVQASEIQGIKEKHDFLRAHGLMTETYVAIHSLTEIPDPEYQERYGRLFRGTKAARKREDLPAGITVDDWKGRVQEQLEYLRSHSYTNYRNHFGRSCLISWDGITPADIDRLSEHIRTTDFVVIVRTQPVAESFVDLQKDTKVTASEIVLENVFAFINSTRTGSAIPDGGFDIANGEHIRFFFEKFIPVNMGNYLGELHKLGLVHGWPHGQNWKLDVSLIDHDSLKGIPFGDPPPTATEQKEDIEKSIEAIDMLFNFTTMGSYSLPDKYDSYIAKKLLMHDDLRNMIDRERFFVLALAEDQTLQKRIFALRREVVCRFLASYLKQQGKLQPSRIEDRVRAFLDKLILNERDRDFSKADYEARVVEIVQQTS